MDSTAELEAMLTQDPLDEDALARMREAAFASHRTLERFETLLRERAASETAKQPAEALRIGLCFCLLGRFEEAVDWLKKAEDCALKYLYLGRAQRALKDPAAAHEAFEQARQLGAAPVVIAVERAQTALATGNAEQAEAFLTSTAEEGRQAADWHVCMGKVKEAFNLRDEAVRCYEEALNHDADHPEAIFRLAYLADLAGDETTALDYYECLASTTPVHVNALLNLAVLYEDRQQYEAAEQCIRKVLSVWPNHDRANLFLKDVLASKDMVIDEDVERVRERRSALFDVPLSDFELSMRARNCLKSMGINTLGDLLRVTEEQLLAYKNFGETSLTEIKELLASKGLRLGQALEEERRARQEEILKQVQGDPAVLVKDVSELQLSVRARKALQRLNIQTIGELAAHSEAELLAVKNFGLTSLNEIKQRLAEYGLTLRRSGS